MRAGLRLISIWNGWSPAIGGMTSDWEIHPPYAKLGLQGGKAPPGKESPMTTATATRKVTKADAYAIYVEACIAAEAAAKACTPTPIIVGTSKAIFGPGSDEIDYSKTTYYVPSGLCGNASVRVKPARGAFVTMAKQRGIGRPNSYSGGYSISAWEFANSIRGSQSYEIACAAAKAAADVLTKYGITCYFDSYID